MNRLPLLAFVLLTPFISRAAANLTADQIVQRSVQANDRDWKAAPQFSFTEVDTVRKGARTSRNKYEVLMIDGSTYHRLLAVDGTPLPPPRAQEEERKLQREIQRRHSESAGARRSRIAKYAQERRQDHALMSEMVKAFQYKLLGSETVNGHPCYVIDATPKPGYAPPNRDSRVLLGMRGKLWIDQEQFQWVKVHAEVFRPVAFGLFIAHVQPGTEFTLEEAPVGNGIWLPSHFSTNVKANVLGLISRNSNDDETYTNYKPMPQLEAKSQGR